MPFEHNLQSGSSHIPTHSPRRSVNPERQAQLESNAISAFGIHESHVVLSQMHEGSHASHVFPIMIWPSAHSQTLSFNVYTSSHYMQYSPKSTHYLQPCTLHGEQTEPFNQYPVSQMQTSSWATAFSTQLEHESRLVHVLHPGNHCRQSVSPILHAHSSVSHA